jgi:cell shape-determining protein MreC
VGLSRSSTLFLIGLLVLIALSLHPVPNVERAVDALFAPARLLGELARPFAWLDASAVRAADRELEAQRARDEQAGRDLLLAMQAAAMPPDPALERGRALVGAHVIGRSPKNEDELLVRFPADAGIAPGMPVVSGDVYLGRVHSIDPSRNGEGVVRLVTAKEFRVGAEAESEGGKTHLLVGGLLHDASGGLLLVAHHPSVRKVRSGIVRVRESAAGDAELADGFRLGTLSTRIVRGAELLVVEAAIDYAHGLNHVAIVCPPQMATAGPVLPLDPFDAKGWIETRALLAGNASSWRATRKLALGSSDDVHVGAAVAVGANFAGRIARSERWSSDVALLGDPGLSVGALARIEGVSAPFALGRISSRGVDGSDGTILFEWEALVPFEREGGVRARAEIYTAAADRDVPPGLRIGTTEIPGGSGPFVLRVKPALDLAKLVRARVWRTRASTPGGAGRP